MKRLITKSDRLAVQKAQFDFMLERGWIKTEYKTLVFFTRDETRESDKRACFMLKVFRGTAANPVEYVNYGSDARRAEVIANYKKNFDSHEAYKASRPKNKSSHALAASQMKEELQKAFPGVKFSVKSDSYTGGDSIRASWVDGPTRAEVEAITDKYQMGHFDGMADIYEYSNRRDDVSQVKYTFAERQMSQEAREVLTTAAQEILDNGGWHKGGDIREASDFVYRVYQYYPVPFGAVVLGFRQRTEAERASDTTYTSQEASWYALELDMTNVKEQKPQPINPLPTKAQKRMADKQAEVVDTTPAVPVTSTGNAIMVVNRETETDGIQIVDYSEKALAIFGDTRAFKDMLSDMGGKWNKFLKHNGETKAGWIFSKKRAEQIKNLLGR